MQGKFIVFYGVNNLGKTTQAKMLVDYLNKKSIKIDIAAKIFDNFASYE